MTTLILTRASQRRLAAAGSFCALSAAAGALYAAPVELICADDAARNCFRDDIFLLNGDETVTRDGASVPLVGCKATDDCYITSTADLFHSVGLTAAVRRAFEILTSAGVTLPGWDEVVLFTADFGPKTQPGPLFFRAVNQAGMPVNRVDHLGLPALAEPDADAPVLGIIDGGNIKALGTAPTTAIYAPCGKLPPRPIDPPKASDQAAGAICAPGIYSYFDALAQVTAGLYGPNLLSPDPMRSLTELPLMKGALVSSDGTPKFPDDGPLVNVWNAFLDTGGSLLGGNTFRDNGNTTFETARPAPYYGVPAPFEAKQQLRFRPLDLYLLGFASSAEVPPLNSFASAAVTDVYYPPALTAFGPTMGPGMGTRLGGAILRSRSGLPNSVGIAEVVAANGGEREPPAEAAPQQLRQLWIAVSKPSQLRQQVADKAYADAVKAAPPGAPPDMEKIIADSLKAQTDAEKTQLNNLQKFRRSFGQYFYMLAAGRGHIVTRFEGNVDDTAYWEFSDPVDDAPVFVPNGLDLQLKGVEGVPYSSGNQQSVLRVLHTPGSAGTIRYVSPPERSLLMQGSDTLQAPNNVFSIRMRLPKDAALTGQAKAKVVLEGPNGSYGFDVPSHPDAYLVPDGRFRTYTVLLSQSYGVEPLPPEEIKPPLGTNPPETEKLTNVKNPDYTGKDYTSFTLTPSSVELSGLEIEFIRWGNSTDVADTDKNCAGTYLLDGWLGAEDNCPRLYNPLQLDGNGDGIGDDCEDYDGDIVLNACDNCPADGNGSQQDGDADGIGDLCSGGSDSNGCAVSTEGPGATGAGLGLLGLGAVGWIASRRRRRASKHEA